MLSLPIFLPLVLGLNLLVFNPKNLKMYVQATTVVTALLVCSMPFIVSDSTMVLGTFSYGLQMSLKLDEIAVLFSVLFACVWVVVTNYSFAYLKNDPAQKRFFAFFLATLASLIGVAYADNLVTFYMFFEMISCLSLALVIHDRTQESLEAGKKYLFYSMGGALLGLIAIFYFYSLNLPVNFVAGGIAGLSDVAPLDTILFFVVLYIIGFGCKAGLFPLHGWLKSAHPIAPAPASAVLSGITTKAGIIAIIRVLYYVVGPEMLVGTWAQEFLLGLSLLTIFLGSMLAYKENVIKTRLAYSTVSQVSYVIFGLLIFNKYAFIGALLQVVFHAVAKDSLFMCAGTFIHELHVTTVDKLKGYGKAMKKTFVFFTIAGLSLVGIPFTAGFVSKWYLAIGALENTRFGFVGVAVIMISALLTAGYLLTISASAFFVEEKDMVLDEVHVPKAMNSMILSVLIIFLGVYPLPLIEFFTAIADKVL